MKNLAKYKRIKFTLKENTCITYVSQRLIQSEVADVLSLPAPCISESCIKIIT